MGHDNSDLIKQIHAAYVAYRFNNDNKYHTKLSKNNIIPMSVSDADTIMIEVLPIVISMLERELKEEIDADYIEEHYNKGFRDGVSKGIENLMQIQSLK